MIHKLTNLYTPKNFIKYYNKFLGVDFYCKNTKTIFVSSDVRNHPINIDFYYPIIVSDFCGKIIFSISPKYFDDISKLCNDELDFENIQLILHEYFSKKQINFEIKTMNRMAKFSDTKTVSKAVLLKNNMKQYFLDSFSSDINLEEKLNKWEKVKKNIKDTCYFCFLQKGKILSTSFVSDIIYGTGNIVVFTKKEHRLNGYARECLIKCINWCFSNNILPIYFVDTENKGSIKLAQSLEFKNMSKEIVVLIKNN